MELKNARVFLIESRAERQPRGGVARYIRHLVEGLHAKYADHFIVCSGLNELPTGVRRTYLPLRYPWRYSSPFFYEATFKLENLLLSTAERRFKPQVIFSPFYGPLSHQTPQVFTVYDLILHLFPEYFPSKGRVLELEHMRRCFVHASAVLCISKSSKADLLRLHPGINPQKVHVIPLGVSEHFFYSAPALTLSRPYFLFVGTRIGYKNFVRLLKAFAISGLERDFDLRVISPRGIINADWSETERNIIISNGLEQSVKLTIDASEAELATAYAGATAFVQPSEYEGFGLPILEAMASGTIVACSNNSSLPESGGSAAFYFDPLQVDSIAASLLEIAQLGATQRSERIRTGQQHARTMSWDKCVTQTCEVLESIASLNQTAD
jgi:glycosyltransferase involved in cell wall biosynthesis